MPSPSGTLQENRGRQPIAVIDIDGVVADVRHRLHLIECRPKDYFGFHSSADADRLLPQGAAVVHELAQVCRIVYLSGRPEWIQDLTEHWLQRHGLPSGPVYLRPSYDYRPARLYKVDVLRALAERDVISVVVDDDLEVIDAVTGAGFDVLPATWMPRSASLQEAQETDGRT